MQNSDLIFASHVRKISLCVFLLVNHVITLEEKPDLLMRQCKSTVGLNNDIIRSLLRSVVSLTSLLNQDGASVGSVNI